MGAEETEAAFMNNGSLNYSQGCEGFLLSFLKD